MCIRDREYLVDDNKLVCQGVDRGEPFVIPSCEQIRSVGTGPAYTQIRSSAGGDYGMSFGHYDCSKKFHPPTVHSNPHRALMADKPSVSFMGGPSDNHRGKGQNVLYQALNTQFVPGNTIGANDRIYTNHYNIVGPGACVNDSVIGPGNLLSLIHI